MKVALRIVGALYLLSSFIPILQIPRLVSLYQDFGAEIPIYNILLIPFGIFMWSVLLFVASSSQNMTNKVKIALLFLSILAPAFFYVYALTLPIYMLKSQF